MKATHLTRGIIPVSAVFLVAALNVNPVLAQNPGDQKSPDQQKTFEGKIVRLVDYLSGEHETTQSQSRFQRQQTERYSDRKEQSDERYRPGKDQELQQPSSQTKLRNLESRLDDYAQTIALVAKGDSSDVFDFNTGNLYVLVFDPDDPASQSAYKQAVNMATHSRADSKSRSSESLSRNKPGKQGEGSPINTVQREREKDRLHVREEQERSSVQEAVKVTGIVMEKKGLKAILISRVSRTGLGDPLERNQNRQEDPLEREQN